MKYKINYLVAKQVDLDNTENEKVLQLFRRWQNREFCYFCGMIGSDNEPNCNLLNFDMLNIWFCHKCDEKFKLLFRMCTVRK